MKRNYLIKFGLLLVFLFITFFAFKTNLYAANFKYSDFNWEELLKENRNFWTSTCEDNQECVDKVLETKKEFYETLYRLLAKVEKDYGYVINDNYIIATVFYKLNPDSFKDPDDSNDTNPYNIDKNEDTKNKYIGSFSDSEIDAAKKYFEEEKDSLKTLVNSFIGYSSMCYGVADETPSSYTDNQGNNHQTCSSSLMEVINNKCVTPIDGPYKGSFFDSLGLTFLGSENSKKCASKAQELGYKDPYLTTTSEKVVNNDFFWDFLINSTYFDKKAHLQSEFDLVLANSGYKSLEELENNAEDYEKYKDDIIDARKGIVKGIKGVIESYGEENFSKLSEQFASASANKYWWPIGSDSTNETDNVLMALDAPAKTSISSSFGLRTDPVNGKSNAGHKGIDIPGDLNVTNVIASKDGVIVKSTKTSNISCKDGSDTSCGGGYGNHIVIQHADGNYTLYGHLAEGSITVDVGDSVKQGQVIAKVGNSGKSTGAHLHFEVRVGGDDSSSAQNPLNYVSNTETRPSSTNSQVLEWIGNMEGTGPMEGNNYKVYADSGGVLTVGHGITIKYNADAFRAHGINPNTLSKGSLVSKDVVDSIYNANVQGRFDNIRGMLSTNGITLNENQIAALASLQFNCGNINGFLDAYKKYGSTSNLCSNWWEQKALRDANGTYLVGLKKRRIAECDLFVNNNFNMNVYG